MDCPLCDISLETKKTDNIDIDECSKCKGLWFDQNELRKSKDQSDIDLNWMDFEIWKHEGQFNISRKSMKCPKCNIEMAAIHYGKTGVEIDYCSQCQGTWLDGGEFEKIIDALQEELVTMSTSDYLKASFEEAKEILTGPESLMSEWKDFITVMRMFKIRFFVENPILLNTVISIQKHSPFG